MPTDAVMEMHIEMMAEKFGQLWPETEYDLEKFRRGRAEYRGTDKDLANLTWDEFLNEIREEPADVCNQVAVAPLFFNLTQDQKSLLTQIYILGQASKRALRMLRNARSAEARTSRSEGDAPPAETATGASADKVPRKTTGWRCTICDIPLLEGESQICVYCYRQNLLASEKAMIADGANADKPTAPSDRAPETVAEEMRQSPWLIEPAWRTDEASTDSVDLSDKGEGMLGEALDDVAEGRIGGMEVIDNDEGAD